MSDITSTEKKRRFILFCLLGLAAAVAILVISFTVFAPDKPSATVNVVATRSDAVKGGAGGVGSDEYNEKLKTHDAQKASAALQAGESFVPTPVGKQPSVVMKKPDTPAPTPPPVAPVRTVPVQAPRTNDAMQKRMMEDMAALDAKLAAASVGTGQIVFTHDFASDNPTAVITPAVSSQAVTATGLEIRPGDLLYAVIDTGVNSDVPSAVMATVVSGKYKNSRLLGRFQRHDERLVLTFSRAVLPTGETAQLEAYAVDPTTSEASVASRVDTHFFSRWGGLIASAFLEGLSDAKRFSGSQSTIYGVGGDTTDQMVWNTYSLSDQAWIAAGKVGEKAGKIFERNFERPPTVFLESGTPVGVLVLNTKRG
jgi:Type IV secretory pathway, VirB10 components